MNKLILSLVVCLAVASLLGSQRAEGFQKKIVTAAQVNGTWRYRGNIFRIWALGQQKLKIEFEGTYEYKGPMGPGANLGFGEGIAQIDGATAIFKPSGLPEDDDCKITMRFTGGKLVVDQIGICGFGHNVYANGSYRRTSRAKPKFGESMPE
ncbi:MAG TPA: hypothetical protein VFI24_05445 [Pyrinomonadaceae bacterium]|nr:hypothetical protein [Pyrinomonadaceae bacterium]